MQIRYLPALVMLIAGAIGCVIGIINNYDTSYMMKMEVVVMLMFFVIGSIAKKIISLVLNFGNNGDDNAAIRMPENDEETKDNINT